MNINEAIAAKDEVHAALKAIELIIVYKKKHARNIVDCIKVRDTIDKDLNELNDIINLHNKKA